MQTIPNNLEVIRNKITKAAIKYAKQPNTITLVAISKTRTVDEIAIAAEHGQKHFGENHVQEAIPKIQALANKALIWHYIGRIQSNKAKDLAKYFAWVQSIASLANAEALNKFRLASQPYIPLNVCIQINISAEKSKAGISPTELLQLAIAITKMPGLMLRGLMALPAPTNDFATQLQTFQLLAHEFNNLNAILKAQDINQLDTLSIGMSDDFEAAIAAGSTMVRIGTALFGPREPRQGKFDGSDQ